LVGDAFGAPLEGIGLADAAHGATRRASNPALWSYTDDSVMMIAVAESLVAQGNVDPADVLARIDAAYEPARGFGRGLKQAVLAHRRGVPWEECAFAAWREGSRGNGGAVRIAPVACLVGNDIGRLVDSVTAACRPTHAHPQAIAGALLQAVAIVLLLDLEVGVLGSRVVDDLPQVLGGRDPWIDEKLTAIARLLSDEATTDEAAAVLGTSTLAAESVPAALWAFLRAPSSFEATIFSAAELGGDVDSICALAGALAGALHGLTALPPAWVDSLAHERPGVARVEELAKQIAVLRSGGGDAA
jgi:poly(ADP-ribose) glycohydrolase ARH3